MKLKTVAICLCLVVIFMVIPGETAFAHGVIITYQVNVTLIEMKTPSLGASQIVSDTHSEDINTTTDATIGSADGLWLKTISPLELQMAVQIEIELEAKFDSGEPMKEGQVSIYTPDDPVNVWLEGKCDDEGKFIFTPDLTRQGIWEIQVRLAGHGDWLRIDIQPELLSVGLTQIIDENINPKIMASLQGIDQEKLTSTVRTSDDDDNNSSGYSTGQIILMAGSVIWGFVGTTLFFSRKRSPTNSSSTEIPPAAKGKS
jgi:nickel transport protein